MRPTGRRPQQEAGGPVIQHRRLFAAPHEIRHTPHPYGKHHHAGWRAMRTERPEHGCPDRWICPNIGLGPRSCTIAPGQSTMAWMISARRSSRGGWRTAFRDTPGLRFHIRAFVRFTGPDTGRAFHFLRGRPVPDHRKALPLPTITILKNLILPGLRPCTHGHSSRISP